MSCGGSLHWRSEQLKSFMSIYELTLSVRLSVISYQFRSNKILPSILLQGLITAR